jgi:hypothetical protein
MGAWQAGEHYDKNRCGVTDYTGGTRCKLWRGHDDDHDYRVNAPDRSMTWTPDYEAGWGEGYRHGIAEGLARAANARTT